MEKYEESLAELWYETKKLIRWFFTDRYNLIEIALVVQALSFVRQGNWSGLFWLFAVGVLFIAVMRLVLNMYLWNMIYHMKEFTDFHDRDQKRRDKSTLAPGAAPPHNGA